MNTTATEKRYTPEDLLTMPDGERYELVDGKLVERHMGWNSSWIGGRLYLFLSLYCDETRAGRVVPADASYQCFPDAPSKVRKPDVSVIERSRLPPKEELDGHCRIAPLLAAEILSPNDLQYETAVKVEEYLRAGVRLVWVVNPETRTVLIYRADGTISGLREHDELSGEDVLPGFRCRVGDLFSDTAQSGKTTTAPEAPS